MVALITGLTINKNTQELLVYTNTYKW